jgi:hypothetical protein
MTEKSFLETEKRFCINCDNKHGCKSGTPPCIGEMMKNTIIGVSGKKYLTDLKRIYRCKSCPFFRSCWTMEEYDRALDA